MNVFCTARCVHFVSDADFLRLLPFQVLSTRKRKDVQLAEVTVKVILFGFDVLYLDGEVTSQDPQILHSILFRDEYPSLSPSS